MDEQQWNINPIDTCSAGYTSVQNIKQYKIKKRVKKSKKKKTIKKNKKNYNESRHDEKNFL